MKTIGLIGGMSWHSSLDYYRIINQLTERHLGGIHSAKCILHSLNFKEIADLQRQGKWPELSDILVNAAWHLKNAGADFVLICTNTMHKLADDIENLAQIKVLHIAKATGEAMRQKQITKVGLLGTKFTMEEDFYKKILNDKFNIEVMIPTPAEREIVHKIIYDELCQGVINAASKQAYINIIQQLAERGAQGVVLGCTEIPLLIKQEDVETPVFDTTTLHATAAAHWALSI